MSIRERTESSQAVIEAYERYVTPSPFGVSESLASDLTA
jgi:hypothetical protein